MKKTKMLLLALVVASAMTSCDISYDPETRYVIKTHVTDKEGNPLSGVKALLRVSNSYTSDVISSGKTDANGNLILVFPMAENDPEYDLRLESPVPDFEMARFYNISNWNFRENYTMNLNTRLDRSEETVSLSIDYVPTGPNELVSAYLDGEIGTYNVDLSANPEPVNFARVYPNQIVMLHYTTRNMSDIETEHVSQIQIDAENVQFTQEY